MVIVMEPYEALANRVISFTVEDYRWARKILHRYPNPQTKLQRKKCAAARRYIYDFRVCHKSEYWHILTDVDLDLLYKELLTNVIKNTENITLCRDHIETNNTQSLPKIL